MAVSESGGGFWGEGFIQYIPKPHMPSVTDIVSLPHLNSGPGSLLFSGTGLWTLWTPVRRSWQSWRNITANSGTSYIQSICSCILKLSVRKGSKNWHIWFIQQQQRQVLACLLHCSYIKQCFRIVWCGSKGQNIIFSIQVKKRQRRLHFSLLKNTEIDLCKQALSALRTFYIMHFPVAY